MFMPLNVGGICGLEYVCDPLYVITKGTEPKVSLPLLFLCLNLEKKSYMNPTTTKK